jgi:hypothetical protein
MHVQPRWGAEQEILFVPGVRVTTVELYERQPLPFTPSKTSKLPSVRLAAERTLGKILSSSNLGIGISATLFSITGEASKYQEGSAVLSSWFDSVFHGPVW